MGLKEVKKRNEEIEIDRKGAVTEKARGEGTDGENDRGERE